MQREALNIHLGFCICLETHRKKQAKVLSPQLIAIFLILFHGMFNSYEKKKMTSHSELHTARGPRSGPHWRAQLVLSHLGGGKGYFCDFSLSIPQAQMGQHRTRSLCPHAAAAAHRWLGRDKDCDGGAMLVLPSMKKPPAQNSSSMLLHRCISPTRKPPSHSSVGETL